MKKIILGVLVLVMAVSAFVMYSSNAYADDRHENHGSRGVNHVYNPDNELSKSKCTGLIGNPIVNVNQKVNNDADSGEAGNYWGFDYFTRNIKVWATTTANSYCAIVTYSGNFFAVPGQVGPGNNPVNQRIDSPVDGSFSGGYRATFNGSFVPSWPVTGNVGPTNYHCDITGDCPGYVDWVGQYFPGYTSFDQPWWGWKYSAGTHGTWINAVSGNSGNIL